MLPAETDPARPHDGTPDLPGARHRLVDVGEVRLHVVEAGRGPLVVLLHGFPDFWWSWRHQLPALAARGLRVAAPDLRGYGLSDRPADVASYRSSRVAGDVAGLIRALGAVRASVVGHDWGGSVAWRFAERHPDLLDRLAVLNAPHPAAMLRELRTPEQLARSAYMLAFQLPLLPEWLLAARGHALLRRALRALRATPFTDEELEQYVAAARRSGDLRGGLQYYRAMGRALLRGVRDRGPRPAAARIERPVLVIWGERDPVLGPRLASPPADRVPQARIERILEASHFVHHDAPERVNALLLAFLAPDREPWRP